MPGYTRRGAGCWLGRASYGLAAHPAETAVLELVDAADDLFARFRGVHAEVFELGVALHDELGADAVDGAAREVKGPESVHEGGISRAGTEPDDAQRKRGVDGLTGDRDRSSAAGGVGNRKGELGQPRPARVNC